MSSIYYTLTTDKLTTDKLTTDKLTTEICKIHGKVYLTNIIIIIFMFLI